MIDWGLGFVKKVGYNLIKYLFNWYKVINFAVIKMKKSSGGQLYFREIRKKYGLKQTEISKMMGVSQTYYSLVESRKRVPSMDFVERLAGIYGLPIAVLLWGSITEGDVSKEKLTAYRELKPVIDSLIESVFFTKKEEEK